MRVCRSRGDHGSTLASQRRLASGEAAAKEEQAPMPAAVVRRRLSPSEERVPFQAAGEMPGDVLAELLSACGAALAVDLAVGVAEIAHRVLVVTQHGFRQDEEV